MKKFLFGLAASLALFGTLKADEAKYEVHSKFLFEIPLAEITIKSSCNGDTNEIFQVKRKNKISEYFLKGDEYYVKNKKINVKKENGEMNPFEFKEKVLIPKIKKGDFSDITQKLRFDSKDCKEIKAKYLGLNRREDLDDLFNKSEENPVFVHSVLFENSDSTVQYIDERYKLRKGTVDYYINGNGKIVITGGILNVDFSFLGFKKDVRAKLVYYRP